MLTKELAGLRADTAHLRQKRGASIEVSGLCTLLEAFTHEDVILMMAEQILRERNVVATEFCNPTKHPEEYEYDPFGSVVKMLVQADEDATPTDLGDHESIVHAYHHAPIPRPSRH